MFRIKATMTLLVCSLVIALSKNLTITAPVVVQVSPTVPPRSIRSLFVDDICVPPCWFGLIPGESTAGDVIALSRSLDSMSPPQIFPGGTIDAATGYLVEGQYTFHWGDFWEREDRPPSSSRVYMSNGRVSSILVDMNRYITLSQVAEIIPPPDHIYYGAVGYSTYLKLIYLDPPFRISLLTSMPGLRYRPTICDEAGIGQAFWVDSIQYFSPIAKSETPPSDLVAPTGYYDQEVPDEIWDEWLADNGAINCREALNQLRDLPYLPTLTPLPALTTDAH